MSQLIYTEGDATNVPSQYGETIRIIPHVCNDINRWSRGFVLALSRRWHGPERVFREMIKPKLGTLQMVGVGPNFWVANMIAQRGIWNTDEGPPIRYTALMTSLGRLCDFAYQESQQKGKLLTFHCPMFGAGLAGGEWDVIERCIRSTILTLGDVFIYKLPNSPTPC